MCNLLHRIACVQSLSTAVLRDRRFVIRNLLVGIGIANVQSLSTVVLRDWKFVIRISHWVEWLKCNLKVTFWATIILCFTGQLSSGKRKWAVALECLIQFRDIQQWLSVYHGSDIARCLPLLLDHVLICREQYTILEPFCRPCMCILGYIIVTATLYMIPWVISCSDEGSALMCIHFRHSLAIQNFQLNESVAEQKNRRDVMYLQRKEDRWTIYTLECCVEELLWTSQ
jgi:hypothetical protein